MQKIKIKNLGKILVTGGTGFIGSFLVKRLVDLGASILVFDNNIRGSIQTLADYISSIEYIEGDVTDFDQIYEACKGIDTIIHLAFINGTENFYNFPEKVLEVGVKGAINTLDAAMMCGIKNYIVTSSSEVYQEPTHIPTTEKERILIPDITNPRFSYSGGKIITELLTLHYAAKSNLRTIICRPHNFYGPQMGLAHVIPQFILKMKKLSNNFINKEINFPILGTGKETRSFCFIEDAIEGILICAIKGKSREIYNIGTEEEVLIKDLAKQTAHLLGLRIKLRKGERLPGGTIRRCPNINKIKMLGYQPVVSLEEGLKKTVDWYTNEENIRSFVFNGGLIK